jgi:predicted outer membrane protein
MSALVRTRLVALAAIACVAGGNAMAQQATERAAGQRDSTQASDETFDRSSAGQNDRSGTQNNRSQRDGATTQQRQRLQTTQSAQFGDRSTRGQAGGQNQDAERFLAGCLLANNQSEVELGQFAQQQSQNPEVKKFAQQMVQDHQKLVEQLQQLAGQQSGQTSLRTSTNTSQDLSASGQIDAQRQPGDTTRLPGSSAAGQTESRTARDSTAALETQTRQSRTAAGGSQDSGAIEQLMQIDRQIVERHTQAVREDLQQKSGVEFDKCYVGSQVAAHVHMLAALEVIGQQQQGQLAQVAQQAQPTVQEHLEHAKHLMKQLEGGARTGAQAERQSPQSPRAQRQ